MGGKRSSLEMSAAAAVATAIAMTQFHNKRVTDAILDGFRFVLATNSGQPTFLDRSQLESFKNDTVQFASDNGSTQKLFLVKMAN